MLRQLDRRLRSLEAHFMVNAVACICLSSLARGTLFAKLVPSELVPEPTPCEAPTHYWGAGYRAPAMNVDPTLGLRLLGPQDPPAGVHWIERHRNPSGAMPAVHRLRGDTGGVEYRIRPPVAPVETEGDALDLDDLAPKPPPVSPLVAAIRARINKLRPGTVDPDADDYDDEKWLRVGEEV